ncbi:MAG: nucleotide sugar dehydrogenase [Planctomycetota bacterium]
MPETEKLTSYSDVLRSLGRDDQVPDRPVVCIQGLGHVGSAMAAAVANAKDDAGQTLYNVIGVELDTPISMAKIDAINAGELPVACTDQKFADAIRVCHEAGNLVATPNPEAYALADVVVVDVPFDVADLHGEPHLPWGGFRAAIQTIGRHVSPGTLVLVETTVPPGTCEKVVAPDLAACLKERGLPEDSVHLAHSYERVMPGPDYFESIVKFWRVFAGHTQAAGDKAEQFLESVLDTENFPMTRLQKTTASETAKVLENSYRAVTIAFAEEWGRFSESVGIDLFEIVRAIRVRPTHSNMRQPGFGVGGYCLTKDPLMAKLAAKELFEIDGLDFPFCTQAVHYNHIMPIVSLDYVEKELGTLSGKKLLLLGVSYRSDVGDTRYSPSEEFVRAAQDRGASVDCHDPLVSHWHEMGLDLDPAIPASPKGYDAVVFGVNHAEYRDIDFAAWLAGETPLVFDANCVLGDEQLAAAKAAGCTVRSIGRGDL